MGSGDLVLIHKVNVSILSFFTNFIFRSFFVCYIDNTVV